MSTATVSKPESKAKRRTSFDNELTRPNSAKAEPKTYARNVPCENCEPKTEVKTTQSKKKKPMFKLGCWRGAFKGTLDF